MSCSVIRSWTFSKLVGAFLDLAIAYVMLCGSTVAYFASKFLGLFGLNLPCPCNGLFGNPNEAYCVQRFLVEYPAEHISSVHSSVKSKFPFDLICGVEQNCQVKMNRCVSFDDRPLELEGGASCSSVSDARKPHNSTGWEMVPKVEASPRLSRFDLKRKGVAYQRPKSGIRRRRKVASEYDRMSSAASYEPRGHDLQGTPKSSFTFNKEINGTKAVEDDFSVADKTEASKRHSLDNDTTLEDKDWHAEDPPHTIVLDLSLSKYRVDNADGTIVDEFDGSDKEGIKCLGDEENDVKALEQALKEEQAARIAIYLELEKERNAAATAADEAMGMILRLQEEKASIQMQARQYQRMIEEKSAYDAEEMNILKEILVMREREKYVLEKEVVNYKKIILGGEKSGKDMPEMQDECEPKERSSLSDDDDPIMMLHEISESIRKKESEKRTSKISEPEEMAVELRNVMTGDVNNDDEGASGKGFTEDNCCADAFHDDSETVQDKLVSLNKDSPVEPFESQRNSQHMEKQEKDEDGRDIEADRSRPDGDAPVVDVHVVGHESSSVELISNKSSLDTSSQNDVSEEDFAVQSNAYSNDFPTTSGLDNQCESMRRHSDIPSRSPPMAASKVKLFPKEEGSSLSTVDFERLGQVKGDAEVYLQVLTTARRHKIFVAHI
uniref:GTD-binding domain-containing protein n=1 Tax=Kalanchoe fedtschenkoi TaxID=63787 RepID=A0A7N0USK6_KALFE